MLAHLSMKALSLALSDSGWIRLSRMNAPTQMSGRRWRTQQILLGAIDGTAGVTRSELVEATGLSRSAVANGISWLLESGVVVESGAAIAGPGRGRRSGVIQIARGRGYTLGLDFGHNHVHAALADESGTVISERRVQVDVDARAAAALDAGADLAGDLLRAEGASHSLLMAAAGIPGPIDRATRRIRSPTILSSWVDLVPEDELRRRLGREILVGNDADLGALGERRFGAARGLRNFIYIKASHGVGAGIVLDGRPFHGANGLAGEIGHTHIQSSTTFCRCGNRGCLETVVSMAEIRRQLAHTHLAAALESGNISESQILADPVAMRVLMDAGRTIGWVAAILCNLLNPEAVILGGELGTAGRSLADGARESVDRYAQPATAQSVSVIPAQLGNRSEVLGAVALAISASQPARANARR